MCGGFKLILDFGEVISERHPVISSLWKDESESVGRSVISNSAIPGTVVLQAPLFMKFSRQEYWSGLPFPPPGDLPDPGIKPWSPALWADSLSSEPLIAT